MLTSDEPEARSNHIVLMMKGSLRAAKRHTIYNDKPTSTSIVLTLISDDDDDDDDMMMTMMMV